MGNRDELQWIPDVRIMEHVQILAEKLSYNHQLMNVPAMWKETKGRGVKVAILDTGIPKHVDLSPAGGKSFIRGYSTDKNGHATHVGGIIAAIEGNNQGVAGIAPEVDDYYGVVLSGMGNGEIRDIVDGINWAVDELGADIINMSLGTSQKETIVGLEAACIRAATQGVAIFAAAGNDYSQQVSQPARYDSVIAVGAVNSALEHAEFSNSGREIQFATGGVRVFSTHLRNGYAKLSGTSMACPALAGIAALIKADHRARGIELTPEELVDHLYRISYDIGSDGFDEFTGHGIPVFGHNSPYSPGSRPKIPDEHDTGIKKAMDPDCVHWRLALRVIAHAEKMLKTGKIAPEDAFAYTLRRASREMQSVDKAARRKRLKNRKTVNNRHK